MSPTQEMKVTANSVFSGITTFAHLPWQKCLSPTASSGKSLFDIAILGAPYDTSTSYRPGTRFGPSGIRAGSRRLFLCGSYNVPLKHNPLKAGVRLVDCGDIPVTPYDNTLSLKQIQDAHRDLLHRTPATSLKDQYIALRDSERLELLRMHQRTDPEFEFSEEDNAAYAAASNDTWIPVSIDDTWKPAVFGGAPTDRAALNHGTYFYWTAQEGLIRNGSSIDLQTTTTMTALDFTELRRVRLTLITAACELIDSIDPAFAPGTGTPETGGWSTRELRTIIRGLDGLYIVSADLVEVAPAYETNAELTTMAAADVLFEVLSVMTKTPLGKAVPKV
ncbi:hypothetical protein JB92DRAFT_3099987 [Gautieria morchelliformis]|nr:hypothetical protein JB92DRAFT_3099987 [Gautieria morchelliformis]